MKPIFSIPLILFLAGCSPQAPSESFDALLSNLPAKAGKTEYLNTPYVAAGDRLYAVGHQDGSFPDLGWHVTGEMGGIWDHPIKLMDGFMLGISTSTAYYCLNNAQEFINFPMANQHRFYPSEAITVTRTQFVPDQKEGMIIEYILENTGDKALNLKVDFTGMVDLRPVWLSERINQEDGKDLADFDQLTGTWSARDSLNSWHTVFGTDQPISAWQQPASQCSDSRKGNGIDLMIQSEIALQPREQKVVRYFIAGSYSSQEQAKETYEEIQQAANSLLKQKIARYEAIANTAKLAIPDEEIQEMYTWTKYNTDWLMRDVAGQGRGLSAGIPDYPWWFGTDNTYALQGLLATGAHEEVKATIELILQLSEKVNDNGRIMHEASTNGVVFNPGNLNTTPYFIHLLWQYYQWTGDTDMLRKTYPTVQKGLEWLEQEDKDGNGYPDGAGMMEIHGLHSEMIDVVVYTQAAYAAASKMAHTLGDSSASESYQHQAEYLSRKINEEWWVPSAGSFADFRATRVETLQLIDAAIVRADTIQKPWAAEELKKLKVQVGRLRDNRVQSQVVHHNWVVNTPMELGIADADKAELALETARKYTNPFGMYVTGIDRDESQGKASKWKSFSYVGAVMTLPTGVQAISEARYGHADASLEYLKKLANGFGYALPGSMYEVSPDYGMIVQAWNIYAVATPIVSYYFGVKPEAYKKMVTIEPNFPTGWDEVKLENIKVGDNLISFEKSKSGFVITQTQSDWKIILSSPELKKSPSINGQPAQLSSNTLELTGLKNEITFGNL